jgi:hypothetical protein
MKSIAHWLMSVVLVVAFITCEAARGQEKPVEQVVIVHFQYGSTDLSRLFALQDRLEGAISSAKVGDFDGNEIAEDGSDGYLYMYGPDADKLFDAVLPVLKSANFMKKATVTRRYGPPDKDVREVVVVIEE